MACKYEEKVSDLLAEYKGAFMFSLVVITLCGFIHTCVCLESEQYLAWSQGEKKKGELSTLALL